MDKARLVVNAQQNYAQHPQLAWKAAEGSLCVYSAVGHDLKRREGDAAGDGAILMPGECQCNIAKQPCLAIERHHLELYLLYPIGQILAILQNGRQKLGHAQLRLHQMPSRLQGNAVTHHKVLQHVCTAIG